MQCYPNVFNIKKIKFIHIIFKNIILIFNKKIINTEFNFLIKAIFN